jgi:hypothetical protein
VGQVLAQEAHVGGDGVPVVEAGKVLELQQHAAQAAVFLDVRVDGERQRRRVVGFQRSARAQLDDARLRIQVIGKHDRPSAKRTAAETPRTVQLIGTRRSIGGSNRLSGPRASSTCRFFTAFHVEDSPC